MSKKYTDEELTQELEELMDLIRSFKEKKIEFDNTCLKLKNLYLSGSCNN